MRLLNTTTNKIGLAFLTVAALSATIARAEDCTSCDRGQRYCGVYENGRWLSGSWESCNDGFPPPPPVDDCHTRSGTSQLSRQYVSSTTCRAVIPGSNECIARGSATVSVDHFTCVYNNFDGCGQFTGTYEQDCGSAYNSCGC
jgi:hypothetical protein